MNPVVSYLVPCTTFHSEKCELTNVKIFAIIIMIVKIAPVISQTEEIEISRDSEIREHAQMTSAKNSVTLTPPARKKSCS